MTTAVPSTLDRLRDGVREHWALSWAVTLVIGLLAFAVRLVGVDQPDRIMFDETYYAKDAWSLLQHGYEGEWVGGGDVVNPQVAAGDVSVRP